MTDQVLEFSNVFREERGAFMASRLTFRQQQVIFKNIKTGKTVAIPADQIKSIHWQRFAQNQGLRIITQTGALYRFDGLRSTDQENIKQFVDRNYNVELSNKELSLKGFNWGSTEFDGEALSFNIDKSGTAFEIPLNAVSDCSSTKNEVVLNFHHNDDAVVGMVDMRFHMPTGCGEEAIKSFVDRVLSHASVIKDTDACVATFKDLQCLTPRGRYEIKIFPSYIQLHGKTFDYKIPVNTVLRLFQLLHKDGRQIFFILSLDPPIVQGKTRYQFLQLLFHLDDAETLNLDMEDEELREKYEGRLTKQMDGSSADIFANVVKVVTGKRILAPDYKNSTNSAISCSYKNNNGLLYPLEKGFMYVHKPAVHIRFEEISSINFARSDGSTRTFDLEVETKAGTTHVFNSIEKDEYPKLYNYVSTKNLRIKNRGPIAQSKPDAFEESDDDDAYLNKVRSEGAARDAGEDESEEEDEDFNPDAASSNSSSASEDDDDDDFESDVASDDSGAAKKKKSKPAAEKKAPAPKKAKTVSAPKPKSQEDSSQGKFKSREFIDDDDSSE